MRILVLVSTLSPLFLAAALPGTAAAEPSGPSREAVEHILSGYEVQPAREQIARLGRGTDGVLIEIATDGKTSGIRRLRALAALGYVPSEAGRALCRKVIREQIGMVGSKRILEVGACAEMLGNFGPAAAAELIPLLSHASSDVRTGAVRGLVKSRSADAAPALRRRLAVEDDRELRAEIEGALKSLPHRD